MDKIALAGLGVAREVLMPNKNGDFTIEVEVRGQYVRDQTILGQYIYHDCALVGAHWKFPNRPSFGDGKQYPSVVVELLRNDVLVATIDTRPSGDLETMRENLYVLQNAGSAYFRKGDCLVFKLRSDLERDWDYGVFAFEFMGL